MYDSSGIERRMRRQESISEYTASGEQSEAKLKTSLAAEAVAGDGEAPRAFLTPAEEQAFRAGEWDAAEGKPTWCSIRKLSLAAEAIQLDVDKARGVVERKMAEKEASAVELVRATMEVERTRAAAAKAANQISLPPVFTR